MEIQKTVTVGELKNMLEHITDDDREIYWGSSLGPEGIKRVQLSHFVGNHCIELSRQVYAGEEILMAGQVCPIEVVVSSD